MEDHRRCLRCGSQLPPEETRCRVCGVAAPSLGIAPVTVAGEGPVPAPRQRPRLSRALTVPDASLPHAGDAPRRWLSPPPHPQPADYTLQGVIGQGGMGVVWSAVQAGLGREVALKRLRPGASARTAAQLLAEAALTGSLEHPGIVPVHEVGIDQDGLPFYTMRRLRGETWAERWTELTQRQHIEILLKVCDAVAYAHDQGVIHRDLKPANVFLGTYGEVIVFDWGLAVRLADLRARRQPLLASGTPAYMAPEMARADIQRIGPASDIYLLGAIIYEILTGQPPHGGEATVETLLAAAENRCLAAIPPGELGDIARQAMATDPDARFSTVRALSQRLRVFLEHQDSIALTGKAEERLAAARAAGDYDGFARALHAFEDALELWPDNQAARRGLSQARLAFAERARLAGDLDLAARLLEPDDPTHAAERLRVAVLATQRRRRRLMFRLLLGATILLSAALLASLVLGYLLVRIERDRVIAIARERDAAEASLQRERRDEAFDQQRMWRRLIQEDFSQPTLPRAVRIAAGRWAIVDGRLTVEGDEAGELHFLIPVHRGIVVQFDSEARSALRLIIGELSIDCFGDLAVVRYQGHTRAEIALPPTIAALGRRVRLEIDAGRLRLASDGRTLIDLADLPASAPHIALHAHPGSALDNLKIEVPWEDPTR